MPQPLHQGAGATLFLRYPTIFGKYNTVQEKAEKNSWIDAAISTQYWLVDNGQIESRGIYRASIVLRGINEAKVKHTTICKCQTVHQQQAAAVATQHIQRLFMLISVLSNFTLHQDLILKIKKLKIKNKIRNIKK